MLKQTKCMPTDLTFTSQVSSKTTFCRKAKLWLVPCPTRNSRCPRHPSLAPTISAGSPCISGDVSNVFPQPSQYRQNYAAPIRLKGGGYHGRSSMLIHCGGSWLHFFACGKLVVLIYIIQMVYLTVTRTRSLEREFLSRPARPNMQISAAGVPLASDRASPWRHTEPD